MDKKGPKKLKRRINSYLYDHIWLKYTIDYGRAFIMSVISALIFAFGVVCFLNPDKSVTEFELVSGGSSGLAQTLAYALNMMGIRFEGNQNLIFSLFYIAINIPLNILAFKGVGKRFAIFTMVNVVTVFGATNLFSGQEFFIQISRFISTSGGGVLARALFAGLCTGLSSAIAFKFETSAGGFDIVSYYISIKKSHSTGIYGAIINATIISTFYLLHGIGGNTIESWTQSVSGILFSVIYLVETMIIIDLINVRNKKVQIQIITENAELPRLLIANVPHGATVVKAQGAFSGGDRLIVYSVVSTSEVKSVINFVKEIDPSSFVNVTSLQQVYGRFYMRPIK